MHVNIKKGTYRGAPVEGVFPLVKILPNRGVRVATNGQDPFTTTNALINVAEEDYFFCDAQGNQVEYPTTAASNNTNHSSAAVAVSSYEQEYLANESEPEAVNRIRKTFSMVNDLVDAVAKGYVRGLVVSGPPGIGKSYGVRETLTKSMVYEKLIGDTPPYKFVSGNSSPIGLYKILYEMRRRGNVLVLDDCDNVLFDEVSLNLLKVALDSGDQRIISWHSESRALKEDNIPNEFEFEGGIIFLTNIDFTHTKASRIKQHLEAIQSRCHYLDLGISNQRDTILRIKQVVEDGMLDEYPLGEREKGELVQFIEENADHLREISLRTVKKIADFMVSVPHSWEEFAEATCLKREAKFKRLLEKKKEKEKLTEDKD